MVSSAPTIVSVLAAALLCCNSVNGYNRIVGYLPTSNVEDHARIDLDQAEINRQLEDRNITRAMNVYKLGAHSFSYAEITLVNLTGTKKYAAGTRVTGKNEAIRNVTKTVSGTLLADVDWDPSATEVIIQVQYDVPTVIDTTFACLVGGLYTYAQAVRSGCFVNKGTLQFVPLGKAGTSYHYEYDARTGNKNMRTLQSLSTDAAENMRGAKGYYPEYQMFIDYYGDYDYTDKWVMAAGKGTKTNFKTGLGNSDFSVATGRAGQSEAIKKGAAYLNVWMYVVKELRDSVTQCNIKDAQASHYVDKAVAFYAGSLTEKPGDEGIMLYALANARGRHFNTIGHHGSVVNGTAQVNWKVIDAMKTLQSTLNKSDLDKCQQAEVLVDEIVNLMMIPMIQSVLRYAYIRDVELPASAEDQEKARAEGATFAATILPFVHRCDARDAKIIYNNMRVGEINGVQFKDVKRSLERQYNCMNITCAAVGGIWDPSKNAYKPGAGPCGLGDDNTTGHALGAVAGVAIGVLLVGWVYLRYSKGLGRKNKQMQPMFNGNIAAVTEIA